MFQGNSYSKMGMQDSEWLNPSLGKSASSTLFKWSKRHPSASESVNNVYCSVPHRSLKFFCPPSKRAHWGGQKTIPHTLICSWLLLQIFINPEGSSFVTRNDNYTASTLRSKGITEEVLFFYYTKSYSYSLIATETHWNWTLHCPATIQESTIHLWSSLSTVTEQWQRIKCFPGESWVISMNFCHILASGICLLSSYLPTQQEINMLVGGKQRGGDTNKTKI